MRTRKLLTAAAMSASSLAALTGCHATAAPPAVTAASAVQLEPAPVRAATRDESFTRTSATVTTVKLPAVAAAVATASPIPPAAPIPEKVACRMGNGKGPRHEDCVNESAP